MTDPGREIPFVVGDKTYRLYCGNRALRLAERETGLVIADAMERLQAFDVSVMTTLLWAMLQQKHPEVASVEDTDELVDEAGYEAVAEALNSAVSQAFPQATETSPNGSAPGKPARAGTGTNSSRVASRPV